MLGHGVREGEIVIPLYRMATRGLGMKRNLDKVFWIDAGGTPFGQPAKLTLPIHQLLHLSPCLLAQVSFFER